MKRHLFWMIIVISVFTVSCLAIGVSAEPTATDVIVVGAGATGLAAALTVAQRGARVILFEKQPYPGGTSSFAEGVFAVESELQRREYIGITRDEAFKVIMDYSHWRANPRLVRAFVNESGATISWLEKEGVRFIGPKAMWYDGPRTWHIPEGYGAGMVKALVAKVKEKGLDLRLATPVKKVIKESGKVAGVVVEKDGKEVEVRAKAVIIATGGYANNKEWIKKYTGFDLGVDLFPIGNVNKTGDGIRMAWEVGAAEEGMGVIQILRTGPLLGPGLKGIGGHLEPAFMQPNLFVTQQGERYCDESIQPNFTFDGNALARLGKKQSYSIFDESAKKDMMEKGTMTGMGAWTPPGTVLTKFDEELRMAIDKGNPNVFMADSIEALARKMGIDPLALKATLDEYNRFCEKEHDELFAKDRRYLRPLKGPKFYGVRTFSAFLGTLGGIKINQRMEVVDRDEKPIPGLYAGGSDAGGMYGDSYDLFSAGGTLGFAVNSGRIAARSALQYISR